MLAMAKLTLYTEKKSWEEAYEFCNKTGGWLAVINSQYIIDNMPEIQSKLFLKPRNLFVVCTDRRLHWHLCLK